ncbi:MAG TPA: alanine dehydrogenase [Chitinophagales bacterium]|nr:alanine dehydrogenase [Chitinophagales bacterium]
MEATIEKIKKEFKLTPQEALADIYPIKKSLYIGIPKEEFFQEKRIPLTPNSIASLVNHGHRIVIETGAGDGSNFDDEEYINAGAVIVSSKEEVYKSNIILKTAPISTQEVQFFQNNQTIFSPILLPHLDKNIMKRMMQLKVTAIAYDYIKADENYYPYVDSMGDIAGSFSIILAGKYLSGENGKGILLGGISGQPPCKVLIIGAGNVGIAAAKSAIGLGAQVQIFDDNIQLLNQIRNQLGNNIYTSVLDPLNLKKNLSRADVAIGALHHIAGMTPKIITETMVAQMKKSAVIIDTCIDHGGCFETSRVTNHDEPIFIKHGVIHYCVPNITSNVARTASYSMSNFLTPLFRKIGQHGGAEQLIRSDQYFRNGVVLYKGALTKEFIANKFELKFTNLNLLMASDF